MNEGRRRILCGAAALSAAALTGGMNTGRETFRAFGAEPEGERLRRILSSPNFIDGEFRNLSPLKLPENTGSSLRGLCRMLLNPGPDVRPRKPIHSWKTTLSEVKDDSFVWLDHSGIFLRLEGRRSLIDPALGGAFALLGFFMPFPGGRPISAGGYSRIGSADHHA